MHTFLLTLHVVAAVFLIGPLAIAPMSGLRGIRKQDAGTVRDAARLTMLYGLLSLIVFGLGVAVVPTRPDDYTFGTAWVVVSMTLYILAALGILLVVAPSLGQAAKLLASASTVDTSTAAGATFVAADTAAAVSPGPPDEPTPTDPGGAGPTAPLAEAPADDPAQASASADPTAAPTARSTPAALSADAVRKLDAVRGRVAITSGIVALLLLVITILMVTKPFGG